MTTRFLCLAGFALVLSAGPAFAQGYPKVPADLQAAMNARKGAADQRSDAIFASHQAELAAWTAKGKPYLPGAAKPSDLPQATIPAFPGAWGGGMYSFGGRGGKIYVVTNLNDSGPGSFREACEAVGPRTIIFNVAGVIHLKERIRIRAPYITISGATAPGDGVCFADKTVEVETHDVIIRHLRFRRGNTDPADRDDSLGGNPIGNIIVDHVSTSWSLDENISMYRHMFDHDGDPKTPARKLPTVNITIQNSISSESLSTYHHAFGSTIGGHNSTFHHNLWASNTGRNPSVGMDGDFTFVNNVLFNWRHRTVDGGDHRSRYNIINNYFKPGPGTPARTVSRPTDTQPIRTADELKNARVDDPLAIQAPGSPAMADSEKEVLGEEPSIRFRLLKPESERSKTVVNRFGQAYVAGNVVEGNERVTRDNWDGGVQPDVATRAEKINDLMTFAPKDEAKRAAYVEKITAQVAALDFLTESTEEALKSIRVNEPFAHATLPIVSAREAYDHVLANAGATLPRRDSVDTRVIESVRTGVVPVRTVDAGTAEKARFYGYAERWVNALSEYVAKGYVTHPNEVGGWPKYAGTPYLDADGDGLPDAWEKTHGLNPADPSDAVLDSDRDGYTNIEEFLNRTVPKQFVDYADLKNNRDLL